MRLKFCIKPVPSVYACFSCHSFIHVVYNCSVICFVCMSPKITEFIHLKFRTPENTDLAV